MRRWHHLVLSILLALALVPGAVAARPAEAAVRSSVASSDVSLTQVEVRVDSPSAMRELEAEIRRTGGTIRQRGMDGNSVLVNVPAGTDSSAYSDTLAELVPVRSAEPTAIVHASAVPTDPHYSLQWGLPLVGMPSAWDFGWGSASVTVAVIDSGIDLDHPDLVNQIAPGGWDFVFNDADPSDVKGHGTNVAGIVAGQRGNNAFGTGVAPGVKILPLRVLDNNGDGSTYNVAQAIRYATDHGADVINMSFGSPTTTSELGAAVAYAIAHDVVMVAASGNDGTTNVQYPAGEPGVIAVGATDQNKNVMAFTDRGPQLDIVAPGAGTGTSSGIYILTDGGGSAYGAGTSYAAPSVAGVAALMRSLDPAATASEVTSALLTTAEDRGAAGRDDIFGDGVLRANLAVAAFGTQPVTTLQVGTLPNADGWYAVAPTITLAPDRTATTLYRWGTGTIQTYVAGFQPPEGTNVLTYWSTAATGTETLKTATFKLDTTAPSAPAGLTAVKSGTSSARLAWTVSTDSPSGVKTYEVRNETTGKVAGGTTSTLFDVPNLTPGVTYAFSVRARDVAGNYSAPSQTTYSVPEATFIPVYRFYNASNGTHFFTPSGQERDSVIAKWSSTFGYEGIAYSVNAANTQPLYRFYNNRSASHFYTASLQERNDVMAKWPGIYGYEGETYKVELAGAPSDAVYRFYNRSNGSHFFTASAEERDSVIARWSNVYLYEGPVFYLGR